jgi:hypothetical protein
LLLLLQCSDWGAQELSQQQLQYAALDAWLGLQLAGRLHQLWLQQQQQETAEQGMATSASTADGSNSNLKDAAGAEADAAAASAASADFARFLSPFIIKDSSSSSNKSSSSRFDSSRRRDAGPLLPTRNSKQQQQLSVPLLPWLAPILQQQALGTAADDQQQHAQEQQQQQQTCSAAADQQQQQQAMALLHTAQQQLQLQHYCRAFPEFHSVLLQQRQLQLQQQRSGRRRQRQQAALQQPDAAQAALLQQRRQRQLVQLQGLGQAAAAAVLPSRNVFAKLQQLKPARLPTRKSLQYENCRILAPDGRALAMCGIKKASANHFQRACLLKCTLWVKLVQRKFHDLIGSRKLVVAAGRDSVSFELIFCMHNMLNIYSVLVP